MKKKKGVYFINIHSNRKGVLGALAFPNDMDTDLEFCRFFMCFPFEDDWCCQDFRFDCTSVTFLTQGDHRAWWVLGKNGEVAEVGNDLIIEQIPGAGLHGDGKGLGYLECITVIDNELYACGYFRQVYKRENKQWQLISKDIIPEDSSIMGIGFNAMTGTNAKNIYAVGDEGEIYYYNGNQWLNASSPTNQHLNCVTLLSNGTIAAAGYSGLVVMGSHENWKVIRHDDYSDPWWGIEEFNGEIYLAGNRGLYKINKKQVIEPVKINVKGDFSFHRLHAKEGLLWSVGDNDILVFDGKNWQEFVHPDNA